MLTGGGYLSKILDAIVDAIPSTAPLTVHVFDGPFEDYKNTYGVDDSFFQTLRNAKEIQFEIVEGVEDVQLVTLFKLSESTIRNDSAMFFGHDSTEFDAAESCFVEINFDTKNLLIERKSR